MSYDTYGSEEKYIIIDVSQIDFSDKGKVLGLTISRMDIVNNVKEIVHKCKAALTGQYRLSSLPTNIKTHLIKAYILSV